MSLAHPPSAAPFRAKVITFRQNGYFREKVITHLAKQALSPKGYRDIHQMISWNVFCHKVQLSEKITGERNSYARKLRGQKEGLDGELGAGSELLECVTGWILAIE